MSLRYTSPFLSAFTNCGPINFHSLPGARHRRHQGQHRHAARCASQGRCASCSPTSPCVLRRIQDCFPNMAPTPSWIFNHKLAQQIALASSLFLIEPHETHQELQLSSEGPRPRQEQPRQNDRAQAERFWCVRVCSAFRLRLTSRHSMSRPRVNCTAPTLFLPQTKACHRQGPVAFRMDNLSKTS